LRYVNVIARAPLTLIHVGQRVNNDQYVRSWYAEKEEKTRLNTTQLKRMTYGRQKEYDSHDKQKEYGRGLP